MLTTDGAGCSRAILQILGRSRPYNRKYDVVPIANDAGVIAGLFGCDYRFTLDVGDD